MLHGELVTYIITFDMSIDSERCMSIGLLPQRSSGYKYQYRKIQTCQLWGYAYFFRQAAGFSINVCVRTTEIKGVNMRLTIYVVFPRR